MREHSSHEYPRESKLASDLCGWCLDERLSLFRIALRSILAAAPLAMAVSLQAQSPPSVLSASQRNIATIELRDDYVLRTPDVGFIFDGRDTSIAHLTEGASPTTAVPTESSFLDPSALPTEACATTIVCANWFSVPEPLPQWVDPQRGLVAATDKSNEISKPPTVAIVHPPNPPDFNRGIYYKNRLEFGLDVGYLPINIPFVFDVFLGDGYTMTSLKYTLVPVFASLRWQMDDVGGWSFLRGNWDMSFTASVTAIPRGPETRYFSYIMGVRRNFVQRNWKIAPYFDGRLGLGEIDAKGPLGVLYAQGQNFTFTVNMGSGVRYNFNPRYSLSAGLNWMHISNLYLSQPQFANYGINVYGPMFGIDVRIGKPHHQASE
jgi:hypothetical protein